MKKSLNSLCPKQSPVQPDPPDLHLSSILALSLGAGGAQGLVLLALPSWNSSGGASELSGKMLHLVTSSAAFQGSVELSGVLKDGFADALMPWVGKQRHRDGRGRAAPAGACGVQELEQDISFLCNCDLWSRS